MAVSRTNGRRPPDQTSLTGGMEPGSRFSADDMALMRGALDAVCVELGIGPADGGRREKVARRILTSYETGRRAPLYLVHAGLAEHA